MVKSSEIKDFEKLIGSTGKYQICRHIDEGKLGVRDRDKKGKTLLIEMATELDGCDYIPHLIHAGSEIDAKDDLGKSALIYAAIRGRYPSAMQLLMQGADKNLVDNSGMTALTWAALNGRTSIVDILVGMGADVTICDEEGKSAYDYANDRGFYEIVQIIRERQRINGIHLAPSPWEIIYRCFQGPIHFWNNHYKKRV